MILLTPSAVAELSALVADRAPQTGLRLGVEKGGCAGMQYIMRLDQPKADDVVFSEGAALVMIDPESLKFIGGCTLDYQHSLNDSGFKIHNPKASRTCGCGTSFETQASEQ